MAHAVRFLRSRIWVDRNGIMRFVQTAFLTRPTVKHTRSSADTDKSARRVYVRDGPDRPISKSNTWSHIWRGPVGTNIFNFEKCCDLEVAVYATKVIPFDRPHASVCLLMFNYLGSFSVYLWAEAMAFAHFLLCFALFYSAISVQKNTILPPLPYLTPAAIRTPLKFPNYLLYEKKTRMMGYHKVHRILLPV